MQQVQWKAAGASVEASCLFQVPVLLHLVPQWVPSLCSCWKEGEAQKARTRGRLSHLPIRLLTIPSPLSLFPPPHPGQGTQWGSIAGGFGWACSSWCWKPFHWAAGAVHSRVNTAGGTQLAWVQQLLVPPLPSPLIIVPQWPGPRKHTGLCLQRHKSMEPIWEWSC